MHMVNIKPGLHSSSTRSSMLPIITLAEVVVWRAEVGGTVVVRLVVVLDTATVPPSLPRGPKRRKPRPHPNRVPTECPNIQFGQKNLRQNPVVAELLQDLLLGLSTRRLR